jgi:hypothetical protein
MFPNSTFWTEALWRACRTFAQTALASFGGTSLDLVHANITGVLSVSAGAAVLSLLMSVDRGTAVASTPALSAPAALVSDLPVGACGTSLK